MLKFYRICFCFCVLCLSVPAWAQQLDAKEILDRTARKFSEAGGVKAAFTVCSSEGASAGTIRLKGNKFFLETDGGVTTWFDGHTQWSYLASADEVNVSEPTPEELQSINPYAFLSLDERGYKVESGKITDAKDSSLYKIVFTAADRKQDLQRVILYVTKDSLRPARISLEQRGGETVAVSIDSYQTGQSYPDSLFTFDRKAYPTAEIVDLR